MGSVGRYVSGLCVAILGLCAAGWLARGGGAAAGVPDPGRVLSDLRALLTPLLAEPTAPDEQAPDEQAPDEQAPDEQAARVPAPRNEPEDEPALPVVPHARSGGRAAMESMLAGADRLMVGAGEEEAW